MNYIKKMRLPAIGLLLTLPFIGMSQKLVIDKTYEVDKKAKKGSLNGIYVDPESKTTTLSFVTKSKGSKVNFQDYVFDKDYNFVKVDEREAEYTSKKYKGEEYVVEGIVLEYGLSGLVVKKKRTEYKWSWLALGYTWKTTVLDKVKLKDESGNKFYLVKQFNNETTGEILALVLGKNETGNFEDYSMIKIDQNLSIEVVDKFNFAKNMTFRESFMLPQGEQDGSGDTEVASDEISNSDMCFVFSAQYHPDASKLGEHTDFEMVRIDNKGKIQTRVPFKVKASEWNIEGVTAKEGSLYLVGPANEGKPLKNAKVTVTFGGGNQKFKLYQVAKITGDKADYVSVTNMDDFEAKLKKPASQKKSPEYKGKNFKVRSMEVTKDNSLFVFGRSFDGEKWGDLLAFYFDKTGNLIAQYGVRLEEKNDITDKNNSSQFFTVTDNYAYWEVWELEGLGDGRGFRYPNIAQINLKTGEISDFQKFATEKGKPTYYLHQTFPVMADANIDPKVSSMVYLGLNKKGNKFWFGKIVFE